jgi:hypothetical protein
MYAPLATGSGDSLIGELPWSGKWPVRTEFRGPSAQRTLHSQDPGPRPPGGNREGPECYPSRQEAHKRMSSATLSASHAGDPTDAEQPQVQDTTPKLQDDCSGQGKP